MMGMLNDTMLTEIDSVRCEQTNKKESREKNLCYNSKLIVVFVITMIIIIINWQFGAKWMGNLGISHSLSQSLHPDSPISVNTFFSTIFYLYHIKKKKMSYDV